MKASFLNAKAKEKMTAQLFLIQLNQLKLPLTLPILYIGTFVGLPLLCKGVDVGRGYSWRQKACALRFCGGVV